VFVTVGMGPWPFDRLLRAVAPLCRTNQVIAQVGTSTVSLPGAAMSTAWMSPDEVAAALDSSNIVITHAGNTVRHVQRMGRVPIAVARCKAFGEMANDHQVRYLQQEERTGRVLAVWELGRLRDVVECHQHLAARVLAERPPPQPYDSERIQQVMDGLVEQLGRQRQRRLPWRSSRTGKITSLRR
jgi:UDP-N-acetylglucosamine transferase subunit ALG13